MYLPVIQCKVGRNDSQVKRFVCRKSSDIALLTFFSELREIQGQTAISIYTYPIMPALRLRIGRLQRRDCALSRCHGGSAKDALLEFRARLASRSFHQTSLDKLVAWSGELPSFIMKSNVEQSSTGCG
jgi:hypothetical protein